MTIPLHTSDFATEFKEFIDCFTVIGGTPTVIFLEKRLEAEHATKDLDVVILVRPDTDRGIEFFKKFAAYVDAHKYECIELKSGKAQSFRFENPKTRGVAPAEIEIASERMENVSFGRATQRIEEFDMSSIVCEPYIVELINRHTIKMDISEGVQLPIPKPSLLILMKSYAALNLSKSDKPIEKSKAKKHLNDIARLTLALVDEDKIKVSEEAYRHVDELLLKSEELFPKDRLLSCGWSGEDMVSELEKIIREFIQKL